MTSRVRGQTNSGGTGTKVTPSAARMVVVGFSERLLVVMVFGENARQRAIEREFVRGRRIADGSNCFAVVLLVLGTREVVGRKEGKEDKKKGVS